MSDILRVHGDICAASAHRLRRRKPERQTYEKAQPPIEDNGRDLLDAPMAGWQP
jgi:hypothetical protein